MQHKVFSYKETIRHMLSFTTLYISASLRKRKHASSCMRGTQTNPASFTTQPRKTLLLFTSHPEQMCVTFCVAERCSSGERKQLLREPAHKKVCG